MTLIFDPLTYRKLLSDVAPTAIETDEEYNRILAVVERLTFANQLTPEEQTLYKLLVQLVETYEEANSPIELAAPHEVLQHIMAASGTKRTDLVGLLGSNRATISEIVSGQRSMSKAQARILGDRFNVSPDLFLL